MKLTHEKLDKDPFNITYTTDISRLYDSSGNVHRFHREKYAPIIDFILHYFKKNKNIKDIKLLDIGIGYGTFLRLCEEKKIVRLHGMDPFPGSINIAKKYTTADLRVGKIENQPWPFENNYFDVITCIDVVEHLQNPHVFFKNVYKYITSNGIIIVRTPNKEFPYLLRRFPIIGVRDDNPTHINVHNPKYWRHLAQKNGFKIIRDWKGEHLGHIKYLHLLTRITNLLKIDIRSMPILNMFEQGYIMVLKLQNK